MFYLNVRIAKRLITTVLITLAVLTGYGISGADTADEAKAVFFVG